MTVETTSDLKVLLTAAEAYPAFEALMLDAREEVSMSFRIFDPATELQSERAREIGSDWFDLVADTLARGVDLRIVLSDFDPAGRPALHRQAWRSARRLFAAAEASGRPEGLTLRVALHPAKVGWLPRFLFWPKSHAELRKTVLQIEAMGDAERDRALAEMPYIAALTVARDEGLRLRRWPPPPLFPASHHQKLAVVDRRTLYIGGLDLDDRRYDTPVHNRPAPETWHDIQLIVDGPVADAAARHLDEFLGVVAGRVRPSQHGRIVRTLSSRRGSAAIWPVGPRMVLGEIREAHERLIQDAKKLIYLETQFLRDRRLARSLAEAARANPELRMIAMVPAAPEDVAFEGQTSSDQRLGEYLHSVCVDILRDAFGPRFFIGSPAQRRQRQDDEEGTRRLGEAPIIYVHAKVSIFDDQAAIVSSANLNGRSLGWDTEAGIVLDRHADVELLRRRCFAHWLPPGAGDDFFALDTALDTWRGLAEENAEREPERRAGFLLPHPVEPARRFGRPLPIVPEAMV
ncbi:phospholipase D-like domain-containing protein [Aestuariibius sp. 2305UL40-4]|uniref:phospholipase D-like domain-containing protein n=1 Tax=Aestuariibius violaceus TaxID=3234132 RepID=UPI00345E0983